MQKISSLFIVITLASLLQSGGARSMASMQKDALAPDTELRSRKFAEEFEQAQRQSAIRDCARRFAEAARRVTALVPPEAGELERMMSLSVRYGVYSLPTLEKLTRICTGKYLPFADSGEYTDLQRREIAQIFDFLVLLGFEAADFKKIFAGAYEMLSLDVALEGTISSAMEIDLEKGYFFEAERSEKYKGDCYYRSDVFNRFLDLKPGDTYLDVMGGAGAEAIGMAGRRPDVQVVMTDANPRNIRRALISAAQKNVSNIRFVMGDIRLSKGGGIPLPDGSVKAASICGWSSAGFPGDILVDEIMAELARVTAPGGRIFMDADESTDEISALYAAADMKGMPVLPEPRLNREKEPRYHLRWFGVRLGERPRERLVQERDLAERVLALLSREEEKNDDAIRKRDVMVKNIYDLCAGVGWEGDPAILLNTLFQMRDQGKLGVMLDAEAPFVLIMQSLPERPLPPPPRVEVPSARETGHFEASP